MPVFERIDSYFGVTAAGSTLRREVGGGLTTWLAMAYILFVQPAMLGAAGMDKVAVLTATCVSAAVATLIMGLWARYPVALAPGMGLNAFFAFTVCGSMGIPWQQALGLVLCSGLLFLLLGLFRLRDRIVAILPEDLDQAMGMLHGGVYAALLDTASYYAALSAYQPSGKLPLPQEYKINLLAPVAGEDLVAESKVVKAGKRLAVVETRIHSASDTLVAVGLTSLVVRS